VLYTFLANLVCTVFCSLLRQDIHNKQGTPVMTDDSVDGPTNS